MRVAATRKEFFLMEDGKKSTIGNDKKATNGGVTAPYRRGGKSTYSVSEIADMLGVSKPCAYDLVKSGQFAYVYVGCAIRVSKASFDKWLNPDVSDTSKKERT